MRCEPLSSATFAGFSACRRDRFDCGAVTVKMKSTLLIGFAIAAALLAVLRIGSAAASIAAMPTPIVIVVRHGRLCLSGTECRTVLRITDTRITAAGYVPRRLAPSERRALLRAIRAFDLAWIRAHRFRGTCPIAYDGTESIYRFRGFSRPLASCTYDLRGVHAVRLTEGLLATLKPR